MGLQIQYISIVSIKLIGNILTWKLDQYFQLSLILKFYFIFNKLIINILINFMGFPQNKKILRSGYPLYLFCGKAIKNCKFWGAKKDVATIPKPSNSKFEVRWLVFTIKLLILIHDC